MYRQAWKRTSRAGLACMVLAAAGAVVAGQLAADVTVKVRLVRSSGACGAALGQANRADVAAAPTVAVSCQSPRAPSAALPGVQSPGGPLLPAPGAVPYQRIGIIRGHGVALQPLPVYSDGTKITSWRVVTLDNARYVELTIAW